MNRLKLLTIFSFCKNRMAVFFCAVLLLLPLFLLSGCLASDVRSGSQPEAGISMAEDGESEAAGSTPAASTNSDGYLRVHFIDVGQGDSILIQAGDRAMLVDAGTNESGSIVTGYLRSLNITKLDYLIGTHPHEDHIGGAAAILQSYRVGKIFLPEGSPQSEDDRAGLESLLAAAQEQNAEIVVLTQSSELFFDDLTLSVYVSPLRVSDENETGLVVRAALPDCSALLTGDAGADTEYALMERGDLLQSDILKVGHHGSNTSTSAAFLRRVSPQLAVISVGNNSYGHPDEKVTSRLSGAQIPYYRTDVSGNLFFSKETLASSEPAISSVA